MLLKYVGVRVLLKRTRLDMWWCECTILIRTFTTESDSHKLWHASNLDYLSRSTLDLVGPHGATDPSKAVVLFSRSIGWVTPKIICFHYNLKKSGWKYPINVQLWKRKHSLRAVSIQPALYNPKAPTVQAECGRTSKLTRGQTLSVTRYIVEKYKVDMDIRA